VIEVEETNNKKTVLIVDDEPGVRRLVRKILSEDYAVIEALDGQEAINVVRTQKPDIILMDMMMPRMDGLTACYAIKTDETTKAIPVVMLTAIGYELNKKLSEDVMGASGYITKPFTRETLLEEIGRLQPAALR
jgi:CheY-like chemotaxis protein